MGGEGPARAWSIVSNCLLKAKDAENPGRREWGGALDSSVGLNSRLVQSGTSGCKDSRIICE